VHPFFHWPRRAGRTSTLRVAATPPINILFWVVVDVIIKHLMEVPRLEQKCPLGRRGVAGRHDPHGRLAHAAHVLTHDGIAEA